VGSPEGKHLPLFSPVNILIATVAIAVLAAVFILFGNQIFSPGDLTSSRAYGKSTSVFLTHAEFQNECRLCHQPLRGNQAGLCTECHQDVDAQMTSLTGVHGYMDDPTQCRDCHPDHRGREFEPVQFARQNFDHSATRFPIDERHANATCQQCHTKAFSVTSSDCATCHEEPALHAGVFPGDCGQCHEGQTWLPATWQGQPFDHETVGFSMKVHSTGFGGNPITCLQCHTAFTDSAATFACQECHTFQNAEFMTSHVTSFGNTCTDCHDGVDRMASFDHASVFQLTGKHAELVCANCHMGQPFQESKIICSTCHQEPEIHAGFMGLRCQMCHTSGESWLPARLQVHDFPLDHGGEGESICTTCHTGVYPEYSCYTCHEHVEDQVILVHQKAGIADDQIPACTTCHLDGLIHPLQ